MPNTSVKIEFDKKKVAAKITAALNENAVPAVSEQALADCNEFVREDQSTLRKSSYSASEPEKGLLVWNTPYAKKAYYTGTVSHDVNPNASLRWCEKAKAKYGEDWKQIAQKAFERGMGK